MRRGRRAPRLGMKGGIMFKTIVWATDGSASADRALPFAKELAGASCKLVVVHCKEMLVARGGAYPVLADETDVQEKIDRQIAELRSDGFDVSAELATGNATSAADAIAAAAVEVGADVIVVGTRG